MIASKRPRSVFPPDERLTKGLHLFLHTRAYAVHVLRCSGVASPKICWGGKMFDFRRIALFCLGYSVSKHKMNAYAKNFGDSWPPWTPWLRLCCVVRVNDQKVL